MRKLSKKLIYAVTGIMYGMMVSLPAVAEDIQIYTTAGTVSTDAQANLLLILDTSGSMGNWVDDARLPYDPGADYSGGSACYDNSRVYVAEGVEFLDSNTAGVTNAELLCNDSFGFTSVVRQFNRNAVVCASATSLENIGFYSDRISQYRDNRWDGALAVNDLTAYVECKADGGTHGVDASSSAVWAGEGNGNPAWSIWPDDEINWNTQGENRTLFSGHYLNYLINTPLADRRRIDIMKDVMHNLVASVSGINIGLMRFSRNGHGGMMVLPVADIGPIPNVIAPGSQRDKFRIELDRMTHAGVTPLSESFYEAVMYFQGGAVDYGINSTEQAGNYPSIAESRTGNTYISPITNECQKNYVVILTDGDPVRDSLNSTRRNNIESGMGCAGNCLDEIAKSIGSNDQSESLEGEQVISTFTIGFGNQNVLLQQTADESKEATGVGERFFSDNATTLANNLNNIIASIFETDTTFVSPAVSVNAFNRSTHRNDLYFTLFKPAIGNHWPGNLKKYKLQFEVDANDVTKKIPFIADKEGNHAINAGIGFFDENAKSFWSDLVDGSSVIKGGAANEFLNLNPGPRKVYTFSGTYTNTNGVFSPAENAALTNAVNKVESSNTAITDDVAMLKITGLPDKIAGTPRRETLLGWAAGFDVFDRFGAANDTTDMRPDMGSPLHSQPALIEYGTEAVSDMVAYVATNDGYLHAFDADDGTELFSFIPQELLGNLNVLMDDSTSKKIYGLDGDVVAWVNDKDNDGINSTQGDHVYLYIGMRRGGNNIYSVDVTNPDAPSLRWVIKGGVGAYAELGQTWSAVNVGKIKDGTTEKTVLIFGGGYDTNQDTATVTTADSVGRAVFIANADTGALLWSAGSVGTAANTEIPEMNYSIPARITVLDMSGDGLIDRLYAADMGGQVLRFDINNQTGTLASSIKGGRIANLAGTLAKDARRFYYPPDVALIAERGKKAYLALGITSGYRAHPLNTDIHDRIYLLKDENIYNTPDPFVTLTEINLYDATLNHAGDDGNQTQKDDAVAALANTDGWHINLDDPATNTWKGEKGLSEALFLEGTLIVTTYVPPDGTVVRDVCVAGASGTGKVYFLDVLDGTPAFNKTSDLRAARHGPLKKEGIPPAPRLIITEDGIAVTVGTEFVDAEGIQGVRKTFWHEVER